MILIEGNIREKFRILALHMRLWAVNVRQKMEIVKTLKLKQTAEIVHRVRLMKLNKGLRLQGVN
jgi:hypothetical protein